MTIYEIDRKYTEDTGSVFVTGIQALARLPIEQLRVDRRSGLRTAAFVSGYQGSPLGGLGDAVRSAARKAADLPIVFRPGMNEEYAASAVMGSQLAAARPEATYDGVVGLWYGKAPGVDRAVDALRHAVFTGTSMHGGAVAIVGDDPSAKSSTIPSSSAGVIADLHMPLLYPGDPAEALDLGRHAIALSRATGLWSALKIVADVADGTATVSLDLDRVQPILPLVEGRRYQHQPDGRLLTPHSVDLEREIYEVRYELARTYAVENQLNHASVNPPDAWIGLVASGITYQEVREALSQLGLADEEAIAAAGIRLLKMAMPIPFNPETVRNFAKGVEQLLVIEEKHPNIESLVKDALYSMADRPVVMGKADAQDRPLLPGWGSLDADMIAPVLRRCLEKRIGHRLAPPRPERSHIPIPLTVERSPYFCSGCPHNRSTQVPDGAVVGAGIGCHTMVLLMDEDRVGDLSGITCMGNEGTPWIGMADFVDIDHIFQNIGDGTYTHSGQLAIQAAVSAGVNITYKLLFNGTVAMTGGQDAEAGLDVPAICRQLLNQGVARVLITSDDPKRHRGSLPPQVDAWDRSRLIEAQEVLAAVPGVTVLIHDQACAAENRRARKRGTSPTPDTRIVINQRICEGCGDCGQVSNCLSLEPVETVFGRKTQINQTTCNFDYSCLEGDCPSFMTVRRRRRTAMWSRLFGSRRATPAPEHERTTPPDSPAPVLIVPSDDFTVRITGVGGTGVVTVAQILGTAAMLDGFHVRGLDQIGLSQKAGPVVSDLRLSRRAAPLNDRLGEAQADLLLALDQLVAASPKGLTACSPDRTVVVGSTAMAPTGSMITDVSLAAPSVPELIARIGRQTRPEHFWVDAQAMTEDLLGSTTAANIFVVGMAVQAGTLPIDPDRIDEAIDLNGVATEANRAAFGWGRAHVAHPEIVESEFDPPLPGPARAARESYANRLHRLRVASALRSHLAMLAGELDAWGGRPSVALWLDVIERVASAEHEIDETRDELVTAVADGLYKLMAYKDEYEVARLLVSDAGAKSVRAQFGDDMSVSWKLHPPILKSLGLHHKISVGSWAAPAFRVLAAAKGLRSTRFDPFGRTEVRRAERELPGEYIAAIDAVLGRLTKANMADAVRLAQSAQLVRGYDEVKMANVALFRAGLDA